MLTCKRFLQEMNDFLDEKLDPEVRSELQKHLNECPNCWVVCDTTKKTIQIFKGMQAQLLPTAIQTASLITWLGTARARSLTKLAHNSLSLSCRLCRVKGCR